MRMLMLKCEPALKLPSLPTFRQEIFDACLYRIYKLDFCSNDFHIFRFSRSGKREVDVSRFMSKHSSDYNVLCSNDPSSQLSIDASSHMKFMHTRTDSPQFDSTLRNEAK